MVMRVVGQAGNIRRLGPSAHRCYVSPSVLALEVGWRLFCDLQLAVLAILAAQNLGKLKGGRVQLEGAVLLEDGAQLVEDALTDEHVTSEPCQS